MTAGGVVGRDRELAGVAAFLDAVPSGPCGLLLEGEAGIGKTTVWGAGAAWAAERSYTVLSCRPAESEAALSFAALGDLLDGVLDRVLPVLPSPQRRALEVALLMQDPGSSPPEQRAVSVAFLAAVRHLSASAPVVLAIDDLQWLDVPSAATVEFALRRLGHEAVGLLASDRGGERPGSLAKVVLPGERLTRLRVGPLAFAAFQPVVRATVGCAFSRLTIRRLFEASGGNPFYGLELAQALHRSGSEPSPEEPLPVPADLQGLLSTRLAALPDDTQDALLVAACLQSPTAAMLERAYGSDALASMRAAASQGVIEFDGDRIRFTHPLFASAIYSGAPPARRRAAHRRLSEVSPTLEERARHLALSSDAPDELVAAALDQAAGAAAARGAPRVAAELAELAFTFTPPGQSSDRWRRRVRVGRYLFRSGDTARAQRDLKALVEEMPAGHDRAQALLALATVLIFAAGKPDGIAMLEKALDEASGDLALQARIHIAIAGRSQVHLAKSAMHAEAALASAQEVGHPGLAGAALVQKMTQDFWLGRGLDVQLGERAIQLEAEARPSRAQDRAAFSLAVCLKQADRLDDAREMLEATLRAAQEEGDDSSLPSLLAHLADLECWAGNWATAEHHANEGWHAAEQVEHQALWTEQHYVGALIAAHLGRVAAAKAQAEKGLAVAATAQDAWMSMLFYGVLGFAELSAEDYAAAEASLSKAADLADAVGLAEPAAWRFHANHIEAVISMADLPRAERLLSRLDGWGRATGRSWTLATAARCRALLLAAGGDTEGAEHALNKALWHHQQLAMPFEVARTLLVMGQVQRRSKRKRIAKDYLERALAIFESLPAPLWVDRTHSELSRLGIRPSAPLALTATEERVAALAATGHTNRQVGQALFLSTRTVESNLARVYRKLGISSRAELGGAMTKEQTELQS